MEKLKKFYITCPRWVKPLEVDDFIVVIGKTKSNSVYHIAEVKSKPFHEGVIKYNVKVYVSDLITALKRDPSQQLIPMSWNEKPKR